MLTPEPLVRIQQTLQATAQQLSGILAQASTEESNAYYEEMSAACYYVGEAEQCLASVIEQLNSSTPPTND
jgi:uncharacterized membrane protein